MKICYGRLPQTILDEYNEVTDRTLRDYEATMDPLKTSMKNSLMKYNRTRDPQSANSLKAIRERLELGPIKVHPLCISEVDEKEAKLMEFKEALGAYKPKQSVLEIGIIKTQDQARLATFKNTCQIRSEKKAEAAERRKMQGEMRILAEKVKDAEQDRLLKMEAEKVAMLKKLQNIEESKVTDSAPKFYLNKRQKK